MILMFSSRTNLHDQSFPLQTLSKFLRENFDQENFVKVPCLHDQSFDGNWREMQR